MYIKILVLLLTIAFTNHVKATPIVLNPGEYLEINFVVEGNNGVFDPLLNRFDLIFDYDNSVWTNCCFAERVELYDGLNLLSSSGPGWYATDVFSNGNLDFSSIRDGSIVGQIQVHAWSTNSNAPILINNFFGWSLGTCDKDLISCSMAQNSFIRFGEIKVVSSAISEPSIFISMLAMFALVRLRSREYH